MSKTQNNLIIVEKYEIFLNYIYPEIQKVDRKDGFVKQKFINLLFETVDCIYKATKVSQVSKLYELDAYLSAIRFYLRFLSSEERKLLSLEKATQAEIKLSEVGKILNSWIKK